MNNGYVTTLELATLLGISRIAIFKRIKKGQIKAVKFGRNYLIRQKDVANILDQQLNSSQKLLIDQAVKKSVREYGETLKLLSRE